MLLVLKRQHFRGCLPEEGKGLGVWGDGPGEEACRNKRRDKERGWGSQVTRGRGRRDPQASREARCQVDRVTSGTVFHGVPGMSVRGPDPEPWYQRWGRGRPGNLRTEHRALPRAGPPRRADRTAHAPRSSRGCSQERGASLVIGSRVSRACERAAPGKDGEFASGRDLTEGGGPGGPEVWCSSPSLGRDPGFGRNPEWLLCPERTSQDWPPPWGSPPVPSSGSGMAPLQSLQADPSSCHKPWLSPELPKGWTQAPGLPSGTGPPGELLLTTPPSTPWRCSQ